MIEISKEAITEDLLQNKANNQVIAVYMKIKNSNLYFTTPARYETDYKDLIIINPETYTVKLYDTKFYLKSLFYPALISDKDLKEVKSYLTHMTGKYKDLKRNMTRKDLDRITTRIIRDEIKEKEELKNHYKIIKGALGHE